MLLVLAGCFRPAGDSAEPTAQPGDASTQDNGGAAELPPITLISPATSPSEPTTNSGDPVLTLVTLPPATSTPIAPTLPSVPTITLQIITPGMSLGLFTPDATTLPTRTPEAPLSPEATSESLSEGEGDGEEEVDPVSSDGCIYTVQSGDSLYAIAVRQDTTVNNLLLANPDLEGDPPVLQIGQELQLPACIPGLTPEETEDATEPESQSQVDLPEGAQLYVVQSGDVLGSIAARFGVSVRAIVAANDMANPDALSIGQELIIPAPES
ncbi:MAG: LysM peptidoglycan-binding domain-containing protein [Anaerolineae bacterium]|nr:LysM peptidoglycan-binding domain-containing protein [Anaerolineae bacterium]